MEDPINATAACNSLDEDLLDDDDGGSSEDDSAFSVADRNHPPSSAAAAALVTVAVTGVPDLQPNHHQQQQQEIVVSKRPDESRKLFQRLWTDEDEIELLQGFLDYTTLRGGPHNSSHHHHDTTAFYDQIKSKFQLDFNKNQLVEKLRRLKKKYRNVISKFGSGKDYAFKSHHDQVTFEISSKIWGNAAAANGGSYAFRATPVPIDEDEDDPHSLNFSDFQSPNPNGIDVNSKTPRPRKRNRAGAVKLEDKQQQQHSAFNSHANNNQPSVAVTTPTMAAPVMGMGVSTGSMSSVIEETIKSCMSPIFKELLGSSTTSFNPNYNPCGGHGFASALSPIPLGFAGAMGGDKMSVDDKWRKQQILELEVFSKRLELVQDQINEQLQELRSIGN
ncbi:hypothetical protein BUALT_Bualt02G0164300 [Buddleja alternifolia]|uniref:Glabrous enhancer-binding protein-like DBD domain-containing protein n=1 Tax=Buddleja alternifolia TaxID=168488 RepID=A0AAV6YBT5_9LAMI|nr:hypothetical protein BUALT_Bualt02G0164300 [Buddleja alternifolia]